MGRNDSSNGWVYAGVGAVAVAAAGYLVWRYALSPETKQKIKEQLKVGGAQVASAFESTTQAISDELPTRSKARIVTDAPSRANVERVRP